MFSFFDAFEPATDRDAFRCCELRLNKSRSIRSFLAIRICTCSTECDREFDSYRILPVFAPLAARFKRESSAQARCGLQSFPSASLCLQQADFAQVFEYGPEEIRHAVMKDCLFEKQKASFGQA